VLECIPDEVQASRYLGMPRSVTRQYLARFRRKLVAVDAVEQQTPQAHPGDQPYALAES
jgi:hypothetical protein